MSFSFKVVIRLGLGGGRTFFRGDRFVISGMEAESLHYLDARPNPDASLVSWGHDPL